MGVAEEHNKGVKEAGQQNDGTSNLDIATNFIFLGDYQNDKIELELDELYFISSASNYIKLFI